MGETLRWCLRMLGLYSWHVRLRINACIELKRTDERDFIPSFIHRELEDNWSNEV